MQLFEGEEPEFDELSLNFTIDELRKALIGGYGEEAAKLQWGTPDAEMVRHLYRNVYQFSVAKNFTQMRTLTSALIDENGHTRSFSDFMTEAAKIDKKFNVDYLRAEYDTAINSAEMASHWVRFKQMGDPMLRYVTVGDERVRASHEAMNGIQRPMSDPIWDKIYPPNGWNCRCTVITTTGAATPGKQIRMPWDVPPLFQTNLAKTGMLWPKGHPYYKTLKEPVRSTSAPLTKVELEAIPHIDIEDSSYITLDYHGFIVKVHPLQTDSEFIKNIVVALRAMDYGFKEIKLLPEIKLQRDQDINEYIASKKRFFPKNFIPPVSWTKSPDAIIDGVVFELKTCKLKQLIKRTNEALEQARNVIVLLDEESLQRKATDKEEDLPWSDEKLTERINKQVKKDFESITIIRPPQAIEKTKEHKYYGSALRITKKEATE